MARKAAVTENAPKTTAEALELIEDPRALLGKIVDAAVRDARDNSWCDAFESIMDRVAPELAIPVAYDRRSYGPGTSWLDSDGLTCTGYDAEGFKNGFHYNTGLDREGFNAQGFNPTTGLDRNGRDEYGDDPNDPTTKYRFAWTREGSPRGGRRDIMYYLSDVDGFQPNGQCAYDTNGNYLTRTSLLALRAKGESAFKYDREGKEAPASE